MTADTLRPKWLQAATDFLDAGDWTKRQAIAASRSDLFDPHVDQLLLEYARRSEPLHRLEFEDLISLLRRCKRDGVEAAFEQRLVLQAVVERFLQSDDVEDMRALLRENPELLTKRADTLAVLIASVQQHPRVRQLFDQRLLALRRFRKFGAGIGFGSPARLPPALAEIMMRLARLRDPDRLREKVALCRRGLELAGGPTSEVWADLHFNLGMALVDLSSPGADDDFSNGIEALATAANAMAASGRELESAFVRQQQARALMNRSDFESAIPILEGALRLLPPDQPSEVRTETLQDLTYAFGHWRAGDPVETWERARYFGEQVVALTSSADDSDWTEARICLGIIYKNRLAGDPRENIKRAIALYDEALLRASDVETQSAIASNKAAALLIGDSPAQDVERALQLSELALRLLGESADVSARARIVGNLAVALSAAELGDTAANIERAISLFEDALKGFDAVTAPAEWATTKTSLAQLYSQRRFGSSLENSSTASRLLEEALRVRTPAGSPSDWAETTLVLASVLHRVSALEGNPTNARSVALLRDALSVVPKKELRLWARLRLALAGYYIGDDDARQYELATALFEEVLAEVDRHAYPDLWGEAAINLASMLRQQWAGDGRVAERALALYDDVLPLVSLQAHPDRHRAIQVNRGAVLFDAGRWNEAADAYRSVVAATELMYRTSSTPQSRLAALKFMRGLSERLVYSLARAGRVVEAALAAENARGRLLRDRLRLDDSALESLDAEDQETLDHLRCTIGNLESQSRLPDALLGPRYVWLSQELAQARKQLQELLERIAEQRPAIRTELAVNLADLSDDPVVYLLATDAGGVALVVTREPTVGVVWLPQLTLRLLLDRAEAWSAAFSYEPMTDWDTQVQHRMLVLETTVQWLWTSGIGPLVKSNVCGRAATLIPFGLLGLLPLHAARDPETGAYALDAVSFSYAPSAMTIKASHRRKRALRLDVLGVGDPLAPNELRLPHAPFEIEVACSGADRSQRLCGAEATRANVLPVLSEAKVIHLACHGQANVDPLCSALILSAGDTLTLRDVLALDLTNASLVVLSACETGVIDVGVPDEVVSLSTGFLWSGAGVVVSSLWAVPDLSTMLLMMRFYVACRTEGQDVARALATAQAWVRDTTNAEKQAFLAERGFQRLAPEAVQVLAADPGRRAHAHPMFWSAFVVSGGHLNSSTMWQ